MSASRFRRLLLVVGSYFFTTTTATPLSTEINEAIEALSWATASQIDHPNLASQYNKLRAQSEKNLEAADEKADELLKLSEELFAQAVEAFGEQGLMEITAVIGCYTLVSMTLNTFEIPVAEGVETPCER